MPGALDQNQRGKCFGGERCEDERVMEEQILQGTSDGLNRYDHFEIYIFFKFRNFIFSVKFWTQKTSNDLNFADYWWSGENISSTIRENEKILITVTIISIYKVLRLWLSLQRNTSLVGGKWGVEGWPVITSTLHPVLPTQGERSKENK